MRRSLALACMVFSTWSAAQAVAAGNPQETMRMADQVLTEIMSIPGRAIPERLLADAQGVAIIPNVIKIGFIAGVRRGHGVVMVRDAEGDWSLPQFITLTGGSVGWQAGIQGTDVVLVFTTRKGVEGLMRGKFTIGADAAASAGPVGRNASAATDAQLKSEILSYSRSRGLFLGVSIDGSALEIDNEAHFAFYGSQSSQVPQVIPADAAKLRQDLVDFSTTPVLVPAQTPGAPGQPTPALGPMLVATPAGRVEGVRRSLAQDAAKLQAIMSPAWQQYLALPREVFEPTAQPRADVLEAALERYDRVAKSTEYRQLVERLEFQATHELLKAYKDEVAQASPTKLQLPPPPGP